ncbi:hypothetical protein BG011_001261 [Mortierella polycephala]|uniref:Protein kinase domain-containing protein n=1 Tax=Mortierella polycephala TaxID=41804 RepID=A0A9P6Q8K4_9FUNG|nr:hypothetical protein BG011_001261 [Mortierella polycephala]
MGIIHVAEWKGIKVAIKEASAHVITNEVEIYNRMRGFEGVVEFLGVTYPPGLDKLCIVTKYADNGSLSWHLKSAFHKLTWANKLGLAAQITSSIARLHQEGIYHRDLHGGNILIDDAGNAMLTDFGASTVTEERVVRSMDELAIATQTTPEGKSKFVSDMLPNTTHDQKKQNLGSEDSKSAAVMALDVSNRTGSRRNSNSNHDDSKSNKGDPLIGVMAYIAPERFRCPRHFDARCDIYSLGVLLWELTSGHAAFARLPQDVQLAVSILNSKRESPVEGTPEKYRQLYESCWSSDPEMRPSLAEILSTIEEVRQELTEEQLATTRERGIIHNNSGADFEDSLSVPRPTSDYQNYVFT